MYITDPVTEPAEFLSDPSLLAVLLKFDFLAYSFLEARVLAVISRRIFQPPFIVMNVAVAPGFQLGV